MDSSRNEPLFVVDKGRLYKELQHLTDGGVSHLRSKPEEVTEEDRKFDKYGKNYKLDESIFPRPESGCPVHMSEIILGRIAARRLTGVRGGIVLNIGAGVNRYHHIDASLHPRKVIRMDLAIDERVTESELHLRLDVEDLYYQIENGRRDFRRKVLEKISTFLQVAELIEDNPAYADLAICSYILNYVYCGALIPELRHHIKIGGHLFIHEGVEFGSVKFFSPGGLKSIEGLTKLLEGNGFRIELCEVSVPPMPAMGRWKEFNGTHYILAKRVS